MSKQLTTGQVWAARGVAIFADALQLGLFPLFAGGAPEGADAVLDVVTAALLTWLCGFHLAFIPTFIAEAMPGLDLFPTWTAAALYATRKGARAAEDNALVEGAGERLLAKSAGGRQ